MSANDPEGMVRERSAWPLITVLSLIVAGVIVAGIVVLTRDDSSPPASAPAEPTATAPRAEADPTAEGFATPRSDALGRKVDVPRNGLGVVLPQATDQQKAFGDPEALTTPAQGIRWQQSAGVVVPFSTSDGPTRMDGQIPVGFAQTPAGAALAAASITMRLMDGRLALESVEKRVDPASPKYAEILSEARAMPEGTTIGDRFPRPSGYEIGEDCDPSYCLVWLALPGTDGVTRSAPVPVVWNGDDWYLTDTDTPGREGTDPGLVRW